MGEQEVLDVGMQGSAHFSKARYEALARISDGDSIFFLTTLGLATAPGASVFDILFEICGGEDQAICRRSKGDQILN